MIFSSWQEPLSKRSRVFYAAAVDASQRIFAATQL
jgi:hypothetical protein